MTSYPEITTPFMVVNHFVDTTVHGWCTPGLNSNPGFWATWEEEVEAMALRYVEDKPGKRSSIEKSKGIGTDAVMLLFW